MKALKRKYLHNPKSDGETINCSQNILTLKKNNDKSKWLQLAAGVLVSLTWQAWPSFDSPSTIVRSTKALLTGALSPKSSFVSSNWVGWTNVCSGTLMLTDDTSSSGYRAFTWWRASSKPSLYETPSFDKRALESLYFSTATSLARRISFSLSPRAFFKSSISL